MTKTTARVDLTKTQETPAYTTVVVYEDAYLADHAHIEASKLCGVRRPGSERITSTELTAIVD